MRPLDLRDEVHKNFFFIKPTKERINNSVAWRVKCRHCGKEQLVGSSQVKRGTHARCVYCQIPQETTHREIQVQ